MVVLGVDINEQDTDSALRILKTSQGETWKYIAMIQNEMLSAPEKCEVNSR